MQVLLLVGEQWHHFPTPAGQQRIDLPASAGVPYTITDFFYDPRPASGSPSTWTGSPKVSTATRHRGTRTC